MANTNAQAALLLLADGRLPAGSYAHSGGLEPTVRAGRVANADDLEHFLVGRAETSGAVAAAIAAAACAQTARGELSGLAKLETELDARIPSPELRSVSRTLGRQLLRVMQSIHPHPHFAELVAELGRAPHQPIVMGVAATTFELVPRDAALAILHETIAGPAAAAAKILPIDPFAVHAALVRATGKLDRIAERAASHAEGPVDELPAAGSPLLDITAEHHHEWEVRLFAS